MQIPTPRVVWYQELREIAVGKLQRAQVERDAFSDIIEEYDKNIILLLMQDHLDSPILLGYTEKYPLKLIIKRSNGQFRPCLFEGVIGKCIFIRHTTLKGKFYKDAYHYGEGVIPALSLPKKELDLK